MPKIKNNVSTIIDNNYKKQYFAAANTYEGFKSYFDINFAPVNFDKIFIIKGGSGTGKSRLMSDVASVFEEKGYDTEYFYCSSDISSLDGVVIKAKDLKMAIIDGTAPHTTDPIYPGAIEKILNLGDFWNENNLIENKSNIIKIVENKNFNYQNAYSSLKSANEIMEVVIKAAKNYLNDKKMDAAIMRICSTVQDKHKKNKNKDENDTFIYPSNEYKLISSISSEGYKEFKTLDNIASKVYLITNNNFTGYFYMEKLLEKLSHCNKIISPEPLNNTKIKAIYVKETNTLFKICDNIKLPEYENEKYSVINMERFIDSNFKKNNKNKLKLCKNSYKSIIDIAVSWFINAKILHNDLEKIYQNAMDFQMKEEFTQKIINYILKI